MATGGEDCDQVRHHYIIEGKTNRRQHGRKQSTDVVGLVGNRVCCGEECVDLQLQTHSALCEESNNEALHQPEHVQRQMRVHERDCEQRRP